MCNIFSETKNSQMTPEIREPQMAIHGTVTTIQFYESPRTDRNSMTLPPRYVPQSPPHYATLSPVQQQNAMPTIPASQPPLPGSPSHCIPPAQGLTQRQINLIPMLQLSNELHAKCVECTICLEEYRLGEIVRQLFCEVNINHKNS